MSKRETPSLNELALSYVDQIKTKHAEGQACDGRLRHELLHKLNLTRECGVLIEGAKNTLGAQQWALVQAELGLGEQAIQTYLSFARKNPEPITDVAAGVRAIEPAMMVTGLLSFPEGHGVQQLHSPNFFSYASKHLTQFMAELRKQLSRGPIEAWSLVALQQFVDQLGPIVREMDALLIRAQRRLEDQ